MIYRREQLNIIMQCTNAHWLYFIVDDGAGDDQEILASGRATDFTVACQDALNAFDLVLDTAERVTHGSR